MKPQPKVTQFKHRRSAGSPDKGLAPQHGTQRGGGRPAKTAKKGRQR